MVWHNYNQNVTILHSATPVTNTLTYQPPPKTHRLDNLKLSKYFVCTLSLEYRKQYKSVVVKTCTITVLSNFGRSTKSVHKFCFIRSRITITFMARKPLLSDTENQPETKYFSRVGSRCQNVVFAMKDIIFFIFWKNGTLVSPVSCQIYRSFSDLITFF